MPAFSVASLLRTRVFFFFLFLQGLRKRVQGTSRTMSRAMEFLFQLKLSTSLPTAVYLFPRLFISLSTWSTTPICQFCLPSIHIVHSVACETEQASQDAGLKSTFAQSFASFPSFGLSKVPLSVDLGFVFETTFLFSFLFTNSTFPTDRHRSSQRQ